MARSKVFLVMDYVAGYFVIGLIYGLLNGILTPMNLLDSASALYGWCDLFWKGALIAYMIFGTIYLFRGLSEWDYTRVG
jgi:hypothetical protein